MEMVVLSVGYVFVIQDGMYLLLLIILTIYVCVYIIIRPCKSNLTVKRKWLSK